MTDPSDRDQALAGVLAQEARQRTGETPEPEELLDLLRERLDPEAEEELRARVLADPEASRRLLDLEALVRGGEEAERLRGEGMADLTAAAGWRDFQARLPSQGQRIDPAQDAGSAPVTGSRGATVQSSFPWLRPVAALLLLSTVSLAILLLRQPVEPTLTVANLQFLELSADLRSAPEPQAISIAGGEPFILVLAPEERCSSYRLELEGPDDPAPTEGLHLDSKGTLVVLRSLAPGTYAATLRGCEPSRSLERYTFQVKRAP
jgi:hypothetical protein